jgi:hypothetical protein
MLDRWTMRRQPMISGAEMCRRTSRRTSRVRLISRWRSPSPTTHTRDERLTVELDGEDLAAALVVARHGGQMHLLRNVRPGRLVADYHASVTGMATRTGTTLAFVALVSTWS